MSLSSEGEISLYDSSFELREVFYSFCYIGEYDIIENRFLGS